MNIASIARLRSAREARQGLGEVNQARARHAAMLQVEDSSSRGDTGVGGDQ
jgi:hypothetical protein